MTDTSTRKVHCGTHGQSDPAFVCCHLSSGKSGVGFNYAIDPENPDQLCPDAWCDSCEEVLLKAGEWNDQSEKHADIQLACATCYGLMRARNWVQDQKAYESLLEESINFLSDRQKVITREFKLGEHKRYDWDQDRAELTFSNDGKIAVICDVVFVGSFAKNSGTWMWSWANSSLAEKSKARMREVRSHGEQQGFERLVGALWQASSDNGWEMTAIAAKLLGAIGAYRSPDTNGHLYMVITQARWAQ